MKTKVDMVAMYEKGKQLRKEKSKKINKNNKTLKDGIK